MSYSTCTEYEQDIREVFGLLEVSEHGKGGNQHLTRTAVPFALAEDARSLGHLLYDVHAEPGETVEAYNDGSESQTWIAAISLCYRCELTRLAEDIDAATVLAHQMQSALKGETCPSFATVGSSVPTREWIGPAVNTHRWLLLSWRMSSEVLWEPYTAAVVQS